MIQNLFSKAKIPSKLPKGMESLILKLKKSKNKKDCLNKAYDFLSDKYKGDRIKTYSRFFDLFVSDIDNVWAKSGFLHCNKINYLMRILLVKSGFFKDEDIELRFSNIGYISPHQYLRVKIEGEEFVSVDLWSRSYGIKLGDYACGFH
jgi:hypothetical protein